MPNFSVSHFPICVLGAKALWCLGCNWCCAWALRFGLHSGQLGCQAHVADIGERVLTQRSLGPLFSCDYVSLALGESRLSFKLSTLFPNSLWVIAGSSPYPNPFLEHMGFMSLSYLILFSDFPRLESSLLWLPFWLLLWSLKVLPPSLACSEHASADEFSLNWSFLT